MYARGILFGKMKYELGDHSFVRCPELDLTADLEFKVKGWVGGTYNAIGGYIKRESTGELLYELSGLWNEEMFIKDLTVRARNLLLFYLTDMSRRPGNGNFSSTPRERSRARHRCAPLRSSRRSNHKGSGRRPQLPSRNEITKSQPTRRPRSRTCSEKRQRSAPLTAPSGTQSSSARWREALAALSTARRTSSGSSMLKCKSESVSRGGE